MATKFKTGGSFSSKSAAVSAIRRQGLELFVRRFDVKRTSYLKSRNGEIWTPVFLCELSEDVVELRSRGWRAEMIRPARIEPPHHKAKFTSAEFCQSFA